MGYIRDLDNLFTALGANFEGFNEAFNKLFSAGNENNCACCYDSMRLKIEDNDDMKVALLLIPEIDREQIGIEIAKTSNGINYVRIYAREDINGNFVNMKKDEDVKIPFGDEVNARDIKAQLKNGVLEIYMPKKEKEEEASHEIEIQ